MACPSGPCNPTEWPRFTSASAWRSVMHGRTPRRRWRSALPCRVRTCTSRHQSILRHRKTRRAKRHSGKRLTCPKKCKWSLNCRSPHFCIEHLCNSCEAWRLQAMCHSNHPPKCAPQFMRIPKIVGRSDVQIWLLQAGVREAPLYRLVPPPLAQVAAESHCASARVCVVDGAHRAATTHRATAAQTSYVARPSPPCHGHRHVSRRDLGYEPTFGCPSACASDVLRALLLCSWPPSAQAACHFCSQRLETMQFGCRPMPRA